MPKIEYSGSVYRSTKQEIRKEILQAVETSPAYRKEIARVFQMANRRIQNIEKAGLYSPAIMGLNKDNIQGYTKFSMRNDWDTLKREYANAVSFLRQPTSTASGTRQYSRHLMQTYDLTEQEFKLMTDRMQNKYLSMEDTDFVDRYLMRYKDFTGELEAEAQSASGQMESNATSIENAIDKNVEKLVEDAEKDMDKEEQEILKILEDFKKFDM